MSATQAARIAGTKLSALLAFFAVAAIAGTLIACVLTPAIALAGDGVKKQITLFQDLPSEVDIKPLDQKSRIYAKLNGKDVVIASFFAQNRDLIEFEDVSETVKEATLAAEDVRFYEHGPVDPRGIVRAVVDKAAGKQLSGASTITQQYVKNVCIQDGEASGDPEVARRTYRECTAVSLNRKVREMRLAIGLEKEYTKDDILLGYLNIANFGGRNYGIQAAARYYYDKAAKDLTIGEAASLLAIVNNPSILRIDKEENLEAATGRRDYILGRELKAKMITQAEYDEAVAAKIEPKIKVPSTGCNSAGSAGFFCDYVVKTILSSKQFGKDVQERRAGLERKGWRIYTTLDLDQQRKAQKVVDRQVPQRLLDGQAGGAAVSVEVGTGRVLTMVQNKTYDASGAKYRKDSRFTAVNYNVNQKLGAGGGFQPGSTFKAFTLIGWLKSGHSLAQTVNARERVIPSSTFTKCGSPAYDDKPWDLSNDVGETGNRTIMAATAGSVNGAFASMAEEQDLCDIRDIAQDLGVRDARSGELKNSPTMSIGVASTVAPLSMALAYSNIANKGVACRAIGIDRVVDTDGEELAVPGADCKRVLDEGVANAAISALRGVVTGGTMVQGNPNDGKFLFGKTGTTDEAKDTWAVGSTSKVATAVWVGSARDRLNLRNLYGYGNCDGSTIGSIQRHCIFREVQRNIDAEYGGAGSWAAPSAQYLYGGKPIVHEDAKPKSEAKPKEDDFGDDRNGNGGDDDSDDGGDDDD